MMEATDSFCEADTASREGSFEESAELFNDRFLFGLTTFCGLLFFLSRQYLRFGCSSV